MAAETHPAARWELGSEFHLSFDVGSSNQPWTLHPHALWGSGRDALRALLTWGRETHGWRRLLVPSYFCQDVVAAVKRDCEVGVYEYAPTQPSARCVDVAPGDVVLVVAMFGMRPSARIGRAAVVVEDHTHDPLSPWATHSGADYAITSLRKTMPIPDGGVVWSPRDLPVPVEREPTIEHRDGVLQRLSAMTLKVHYLAGHDVAKPTFLELAARAERAIGAGPVSGISEYSRSRLPTLPTVAWRKVKARNLRAFRDSLGDLPHVTFLDAPFAATLLFEQPALRDRVREALIALRIYPTVLWPLDEPAVAGIPEADIELSRRILSIPCDYRYSQDDMTRVAMELKALLAG
jgi:hypothetical protein